MSNYSDENTVVNDRSQLKDDANGPNVLDQEPNYFLTDEGDDDDDEEEEKIDAADKSYVLDDSPMDWLIDENDEPEEEELFNL